LFTECKLAARRAKLLRRSEKAEWPRKGYKTNAFCVSRKSEALQKTGLVTAKLCMKHSSAQVGRDLSLACFLYPHIERRQSLIIAIILGLNVKIWNFLNVDYFCGQIFSKWSSN
jgi:hypothetical protein